MWVSIIWKGNYPGYVGFIDWEAFCLFVLLFISIFFNWEALKENLGFPWGRKEWVQEREGRGRPSVCGFPSWPHTLWTLGLLCLVIPHNHVNQFLETNSCHMCVYVCVCVCVCVCNIYLFSYWFHLSGWTLNLEYTVRCSTDFTHHCHITIVIIIIINYA